ncbi:MAG TPA: GldG family protein [Gammaproteobacteria bacterium]|nr:GldG family protein [Gammaproteobacteria bacterium]
MRVTRKSRRQLVLQNGLFLLLFFAAIALLARLSTQYHYEADWTYGERNSLSPASVQLLKSLDKPLTFTAYLRSGSPLKDPLRRFVARYQQVKKDTSLALVNTDTNPEAARAAGITTDGELEVAYAGRSEKLTQINEAELGNAIQRLARSAERYAVFLTGDGERDPLGQHNFDLGDFGKQLQDKGIKVETLSLAANPTIPQNTSVLVIAGPQADLLPGMVNILRDYVKRGGNLLWLGDPGPLYGLQPLAQDLGLRFGAGTIVDPESQLFGINDPKIILVPKYDANSPLTKDFSTASLFPAATSVDEDKDSNGGWQADEFLKTLPRSWLETGKLEGDVNYDPKRGDRLGPLTIGVALTRPLKSPKGGSSGEQRVVATGDGDFLSNSYLGNGGNLQLGLNIFNWLAHDDSQISINPRPAPDLTLILPPLAQGIIGFGFLLVLPLLLLASGIGVWLRRRRR